MKSKHFVTDTGSDRYGIGLYSMPKCALEICQFIILKLIHQNKRKGKSRTCLCPLV
jgi:hypothetical protein